jgi:hypothetical protein
LRLKTTLQDVSDTEIEHVVQLGAGLEQGQMVQSTQKLRFALTTISGGQCKEVSGSHTESGESRLVPPQLVLVSKPILTDVGELLC